MRKMGLVMLVAVLSLGVNVYAQYGTANIVGTVTDASGAVIPNVKVVVTEPAKGFVRNLVTDSKGSYSIQNVPIGTYSVTFEDSGFSKLVETGIVLTTGQTQRVNGTLSVGAVTETVTVSGAVPHVQTESAALSTMISGQQISQLEINGRNFVRLSLLIPGAVPNGLITDTVGVYANNNISFNGSRTQYNNWTVDGAPNTDEGSASTFNTYPNLDSIAEFRVSTSNYGAEYGHHAGAQIDVVTKSGTKQFHGTASEYLRNDVFDAQNFFTNRYSGGVPPARAPLKQNEYGWTIGGPAFIPHLYNTDKSKTFFFWSEDWRKIRGSSIFSLNQTLSMAQRQGDFSECDPFAAGGPNAGKGPVGVGNDLPYNATVAKGCTLPVVNGVTYDNILKVPGIDAQSVTNAQDLISAYFPKPNIAGNPVGWSGISPANTDWREDQIRVDQNIGDKTRLFVRYTHDAWNTTVNPTLWAWGSGSMYNTNQTGFLGPGKSAVLNITNTFSPTLMNEFIAGYTEDWITLTNHPGGESTGITRPSGFNLAHFFPANAGNPLLPALVICGGTSVCVYNGAYSANPWTNSNPIVDFQDNMTKVYGNHIFKFGAYFEDYRKNETFGDGTQGEMDFWSGQPGSSGSALADMFLGQLSDYIEGTQTSVSGVPVGGNSKGHWLDHDFEPYFEDDWHVTPHLTLNIGLRYYYFTHIHDITNPTVDSGFLPQLYNPTKEAQYNASGNLIQGTGATPLAYGNGLVECGHGGIPAGCQTNTYNNWAPRFGFAYSVGHSHATSIRGGYGIFYEIGNGNEAQSEGGEGNPPHELGLTAYNLTEATQAYPGQQILGPIYNNGVYAAPIPPAGYTMWPYSQKWPSEQQFNISVEHQFANDNLFSLAYVGALGHHLALGYPFNNIPLGEGTVDVPQLAGSPVIASHSGNLAGSGNYQVCDASGNCDVQQYNIHGGGTGVFFQPYRGYAGINMKADIANSNYNALQASFRHTFGHGLTATVAYTWSHNLDDATSTYTENTRNVDPFNQERWYATSDNNRTQVFTTSYIYNLPFFTHAGNRFVRGALGGWEVSGITTFMTGLPVNFQCGMQYLSTGIGGGVQCNTLGPLKINKTTYNDPTYGPTLSWYNPGVVSQPLASQLLANGEPGMFGYMGRNVLTGPGANDTDLALMKNWKVAKFGEGGRIQFRWETYNTFNHVNWTGFNTGCSSQDGFGEPCNNPKNDLGTNALGEVNSAGDARVMQLGLEIYW